MSQLPTSESLVNAVVAVPAKSPYTNYGVNVAYIVSGGSNAKINGTLLEEQCCISFYIFTDTAWNQFTEDGSNSTNSTNSPVFTENYTALNKILGASKSFTFIPDPTRIYMLVFFNENRSLWDTNSSAVSHVVADIYLYYSIPPEKLLIYPSVALIVAGAALILVRYRFLND